jgi:hypothetical protein
MTLLERRSDSAGRLAQANESATGGRASTDYLR